MAADSEPSTPGTPSKRRRISSWATLLAPIISNEDQRGLDGFLDATIQASVFLTNPIKCQKAILQDALPGQDELVDNILKCTSNYQAPTLESKIEDYLVAPSKVKETEVIRVACYIFGTRDLASTAEIKELVTKQSVKPAAVESQDSDAEDVACSLVLTDIFDWTHNLAEEAAPGYLPLGYLVVFFGKKLSEALNRTYKCHPQRVVARNDNPGQNPSTDVAIVIRVRDGVSSGGVSSGFVSKVLYEYKTSVNPLLDMVETKDLMELFLQCYYTLKYEKQSSILGCLTDLLSWHYINLTRDMSGKLKVTFYCRLQMDKPPSKTQIASHLSFLVQRLK